MTAYGLELLLQLSQITQPISTSLLISTLTDSFSKILTAKKEKLALPSYDIYA